MKKVISLLLATVLALSLTSCAPNNQAPSSSAAGTPAVSSTAASTAAVSSAAAESTDPLSLWTEGAETRKQLTEYMKAITTEGSPDFIPVERRIAVFDLDGTLCSETNPIYFDHCTLLYRVLEDPDYKDKASDFEKETCYEILDGIRAGEYPKGMDVKHGQAVASAFKGMTMDEFVAYVRKFRETPAPGYDGMTRGESFYKPMLQIIDYLKANDFMVYIISGTDRMIVRGLVEDNVDLPFHQVIGSDETLVATGQGDTPGLEYTYTDKDKLILGGEFIIKNLKMNKVSVIAQEIGLQPVLSFGNTTGDAAMNEYTITNNKYKSLAFMLCCDDLEREYGNETKARKMQDMCKEFHWIPISMKNDWTTIYGDKVKKNPNADLSYYFDKKRP